MEFIRVSDEGEGFETADKRGVVPWGFNYDHDEEGRLLEDYWRDEWSKVEEDFREMKDLGANVVRIHLQVGKFMENPDTPDAAALEMLERLVGLAEEVGLYLDLTGLGCYHKSDVPPWYDDLSESERWDVQAVFWGAVAGVCADSPAVFCYDLMNEPVVPGGRREPGAWLGPGFAGKHFVQFITLDSAGRERAAVARDWIRHLTAAIRDRDSRHLITVGLVPWSLDRPGLTSGFVPEKISDAVDFISVHIYPEKSEIDKALETLKEFDVGKPVLIEETFPLKCSAEGLGEFIEKSREIADGWIGFYWGKTIAEYNNSNTISAAITLEWLKLFKNTDIATD